MHKEPHAIALPDRFKYPTAVLLLWLGSLVSILFLSSAFSDHHILLNQLQSKWDGGWYESIAGSSYYFSHSAQSNVAFFPLYPLLVKLVHS